MASSASDTCSNYEYDSGNEAGPSKRKKLAYKTSFSEEWRKTWPFLKSVPGDSHSFRCTICDKKLSCGHQGISDVKDHVATQSHQKLAKVLATQPKISYPSAAPLQDKVRS